MAVIINATTTTGLTTSADNSGVIQFQSNGANTVGISSTGYITIGGNQQIYGPAFSAYRPTTQTGVGSGTFTKVQINTEYFDTNNCFDTATNYRFTPNVAGYYQFNYCVLIAGTGLFGASCQLYINGSIVSYGNYSDNAIGGVISSGSTIMYMNGTTDYAELYAVGSVSSGTVTFGAGTSTQFLRFSASMVRGA